jgi:hypothetical protein
MLETLGAQSALGMGVANGVNLVILVLMAAIEKGLS